MLQSQIYREGTRAPEAWTLAGLLDDLAQNDGDYDTLLPGLSLFRRSTPTEPLACVFGLSLAVVLQGTKRVLLGNEIFECGPGQALITTVDLPVVSSVEEASSVAPYLGIRLLLDPRVIAQKVAEVEDSGFAKTTPSRGMSVLTLDAGLEEALVRLLSLLSQPDFLSPIGPLVVQEIVIRLLKGSQGARLRHLTTAGSPSHQIAKVITWLKLHYRESVPMDDLAAQAFMSPSTFRQHFRTVAGMSPLQYLKNLRLQEARQGMLTENLDATTAAVRVGYESPSQFSREYTRMFGAPPLRDIKKIREAEASAGA